MSIQVRVVHLVVLVAALAVAVGFGAGYQVGQSSASKRDDSAGLEAQLAQANQMLQQYRERAIEVTAEADIRASIPAIEVYFIDNGSYLGVTAQALRGIDPGIPSSVSIPTAFTDSYCMEATVESTTVHKEGPAAPIEAGPCQIS